MSATRLLLEAFRTSGAINIISTDTQVDATTDSAASGVTTADCHSTFHFDAIVGEMCSLWQLNKPKYLWPFTEMVGRDEGGGVSSHASHAMSRPACAQKPLL